MQDAKTLRRNFLWNTAGQLIYMGAQFLCGILVVRFGADGVYNSGLYNTALTVTNIFLSMASYGMYSFQVSDMRGKYATSAYLKSRAFTCAAAVGSCALLLGFCAAMGRPYTAEQTACILLFLLFRMVESATDVYNAILQKHDRLDLVGKIYAVRGLLTLGVFVLVLALTGNMVLTLGLMAAAVAVFFILYSIPQAKPFYTPQRVAGRVAGALLWECLPLAIYSVLGTTAANIPKLFLGQIMGNEAMGIYGPVVQPVVLLQICATYLFNPFITTFSRAYERRDKKAFWQAVLAVQGLVLAMLPLGLLVAHFLGRWGLETFVGRGWGAYQYLLGPMAVACILMATVLFYSMLLTVMRCMRGLIFANVCGLLTAVLASRPCIVRWELQGTTIAVIIAVTVQLLCLGGCIWRRCSRHFAPGPLPHAQEPDGLPSDASEHEV